MTLHGLSFPSLATGGDRGGAAEEEPLVIIRKRFPMPRCMFKICFVNDKPLVFTT